MAKLPIDSDAYALKNGQGAPAVNGGGGIGEMPVLDGRPAGAVPLPLPTIRRYGQVEVEGRTQIVGMNSSQLLQMDASKRFASVADLTTFVAGTSGVSVSDDSDGTITISGAGLTYTTAICTTANGKLGGTGNKVISLGAAYTSGSLHIFMPHRIASTNYTETDASAGTITFAGGFRNLDANDTVIVDYIAG